MLTPLAHELSTLDADLPARPRSLVRLLALLQHDTTTLDDIAQLIESDMALAAAVVRTVNSAMFGLLRRVQTVGEAVRYLGLSEVAAITFETALRSAFPPTPRLETLWQRASAAGLLMGRSAAALQLDPLQAHTAGLFERCGQAIFLVKAEPSYAPLMDEFALDRLALNAAEQRHLGITHAAYGSALCACWGLANSVVHYVRDRMRASDALPESGSPARRMLTLGLLVSDLLDGQDLAEAAVLQAPGTGLSADALASALERPWSVVREAWEALDPA